MLNYVIMAEDVGVPSMYSKQSTFKPRNLDGVTSSWELQLYPKGRNDYTKYIALYIRKTSGGCRGPFMNFVLPVHIAMYFMCTFNGGPQTFLCFPPLSPLSEIP